jgi:predicted alpha/beta-fold hydrolase
MNSVAPSVSEGPGGRAADEATFSAPPEPPDPSLTLGMTATEFRPAWWLRGPHAQTIWGRLTRPHRAVALRRELLITPDDDDLVLDHLDSDSSSVPRSSSEFLEGDRGTEELRGTPRNLHFILLHGLEGSSNSVYMQGLLSAIARRGLSATAVNFRSCAEGLPHNRRPRFYHSGETTDFDFVVRTLRAREPHKKLVAIGASLGGNALLKWLGEHPGQTDIAAAATLSVPYDLRAGGDLLEKGWGPFYVARFLASLRKKAVDVTRRFPEVKLDLEAVRRSNSFRTFDDAVTAPLHGFRDADDYYDRSSSIHFIGRVTTPTLCISADDDPFVPLEAIERARAAASPAVDFRITRGGGHTGFIAGRAPWRPQYWAEEMAVDWLTLKVLSAEQ